MASGGRPAHRKQPRHSLPWQPKPVASMASPSILQTIYDKMHGKTLHDLSVGLGEFKCRIDTGDPFLCIRRYTVVCLLRWFLQDLKQPQAAGDFTPGNLGTDACQRFATFSNLIQSVSHEVCDLIELSVAEYMDADASTSAAAGSPIVRQLFLAPQVIRETGYACSLLVAAIVRGCDNQQDLIERFLGSPQQPALMTAVQESDSLADLHKWLVRSFPEALRAAAHLWKEQLPPERACSMAWLLLFPALSKQVSSQHQELRSRSSVTLVTRLRSDLPLPIEDSHVEQARALLKCYSLLILSPQWGDKVEHSPDVLARRTLRANEQAHELFNSLKIEAPVSTVHGRHSLGSVEQPVVAARPDLAHMAPPALVPFVKACRKWKGAIEFLGLKLSTQAKNIVGIRDRLQQLFELIAEAHANVQELFSHPLHTTRDGLIDLDQLSRMLKGDYWDVAMEPTIPVQPLTQTIPEAINFTKTDCAVIVGEGVVAVERETHIDMDVVKLIELALPCNRLFAVIDEPQDIEQWWKPLICEQSATFLKALPLSSRMEDDRITSFTGAELLEGVRAGTLWMQRKGSVEENLCFHVTLHRLAVPSSVNVDKRRGEIAALLHTPYTTVNTVAQCHVAAASETPWRLLRVFGLRLQSPSHRSHLDEALRKLNLLPLTVCRPDSSTTAATLDMPTLVAACFLSHRLHDSGEFRRDIPDAKRLLQKILLRALSNPLLTDFLPAVVRARITDPSSPTTSPFLQLGSTYWEKRLCLSTGANATATGRLLVSVLSDSSSQATNNRIFVLENAEFMELVKLCRSSANLTNDLWRPIIVRFMLARTNLAATRQQLFQLQSHQCFVVVFFSLDQDVSARDVARLVQPFLGAASSLRLVLQHVPQIVNDLQLTEVGQQLYFPHRGNQADGRPGLQAQAFKSNTAGSMLSLNLEESQLRDLVQSDIVGLEARNSNLLSWMPRLARWLDTNNDCPLTLLIQPDRLTLEAMLYTLNRDVLAAGATINAPLDTLDCKEAQFYSNLDNVLRRSGQHLMFGAHSAAVGKEGVSVSTSSPRKLAVPRTGSSWVIIKHGDLLSFEEKEGILRRLKREHIKLLLCTSALNPSDSKLDPKFAWEELLLSYAHGAPLDYTALLAQHLQKESLQLERILRASQIVLGRHFTGSICQLVILLFSSRQPFDSLREEIQTRDDSPLLAEFLSVLKGCREFTMAGRHSTSISSQCELGDDDESEDSRLEADVSLVGDISLPEVQPDQSLALLCHLFNHVYCCGTKVPLVSFDQFATCAPVAQVLPPQDQLQRWLVHMDFQWPQSCKLKLRNLPNVQGLSLLEMLQPNGLEQSLGYVSRCVVQRPELACDYLQPFAARSEPLPWNQMPEIFRSYPPSFRNLSYLLMSCAQPLLVIVSIPPRTLDVILQSASDLDLGYLAQLLTPGKQDPGADSAVTMRHLELIDLIFQPTTNRGMEETILALDRPCGALSILYFHLLKVKPPRCDHLKLTSVHIQVLLSCGLFIRLHVNVADQLMRLFLVLDQPSCLLIDQPELFSWLMYGCNLTALNKLLLGPTLDRWGCALLEAILHPSLRHAAPRSVLSQTVLAQLVYSLVYDNLDTVRLNLEEIKQSGAHFSPGFVMSLLQRLPVRAMDIFCQLVMDKLLGSNQDIAQYLCQCLVSNGHLVISSSVAFCLLRAATGKVQSSAANIVLDCSDATVQVLWLVACENTQGLADRMITWSHVQLNRLQQVPSTEVRSASSASSTNDTLPLQLDEMDPLRECLLDYWARAVEPLLALQPIVVAVVVTKLMPDISRLDRQAQVALLGHIDKGLKGGTTHALSLTQQVITILLWACNPDQEFPFQPEAQPVARHLEKLALEFLQKLSQDEGFNMLSRVQQTLGATAMALWLVAPQQLSLPLLEGFHIRYAALDVKLKLMRHTFVFAQKKASGGASRVFHIEMVAQAGNGRRLWEELCKHWESLVVPNNLKAGPSELVFLVDQGFSLDIMKQNASTLVTLVDPRHKPTKSNPKDTNNFMEANMRYIFNLVCLWFQALGVSYQELWDQLIIALPGKTAKSLFSGESHVADLNFLNAPCWVPVPTMIDIHERQGTSMLRYFGDSAQDRALTHQSVMAFLPIELIPMLAESRFLPATACGAAKKLAKHLAGALGDAGDTFKPAWQPHEQRVRLFANCLKTFHEQGRDAREVSLKMLEAFAETLQQLHSVQGHHYQAWLFRWLCRGIGFSSASSEMDRDSPESPDKTPQRLLKKLSQHFLANKLQACRDTMLELSNYFDHEYRRVFDKAEIVWEEMQTQQLSFIQSPSSTDLDFVVVTTRMQVQEKVRELQKYFADRQSVSRAEPQQVLGVQNKPYSEKGYNEDGAALRLMGISMDGAPSFLPLNLKMEEIENDAGVNGTLRSSRSQGSVLEEGVSAFSQGLISFNFDPKQRLVVVRAPSLVTLRPAATKDAKDAPLEAHVIEIEQGPGGVLVMDSVDDSSHLESSSSFTFLDKRDLVHHEALEGRKVVQTFPSHTIAWKFFDANLPSEALLVGSGILLKQSAKSASLTPLFLAQNSHRKLVSVETLSQTQFCLADAIISGPMLNYFGVAAYIYDFLAIIAAMALLPGVLGDDDVAPAASSSLWSWVAWMFQAFQRARQTNSQEKIKPIISQFESQLRYINAALKNILHNAKATVEEELKDWLQRLPAQLQQLAREELVVGLQSLRGKPKHQSFVAEALSGHPADLCPTTFLAGRRPKGTSHTPSMVSFAPQDANFCFPTERDVALILFREPMAPAHEEEEREDAEYSDISIGYHDIVEEILVIPPLEPHADACGPGRQQQRGPLFQVLKPERDLSFVTGEMSSSNVLLLWPILAETTSIFVTTPLSTGKKTDVLTFGYILHMETPAEGAELQDRQPDWIIQVLSAPLPAKVISWLLVTALTDGIMAPPELDVRTNLLHCVVAFSLADTCPFQKARPFLMEALQLVYPLSKYFGHVSEVYGIYICSSDSLHTLQLELKVPLKVVDVSLLRARGVVAKDQLYAHIVQEFSDSTLIVYVRGMRLIEDQLLKWCAEFTKQVPYAYIYFEELNTDRNFTENRDRCKMQLYLAPTLLELSMTAQRRDTNCNASTTGPFASVEDVRFSLNQLSGAKESTTEVAKAAEDTMKIVEHMCPEWRSPPSGNTATELVGAWKRAMLSWLNPFEKHEREQVLRAFVVISPPGAGKTVFIEKVLRPQLKAQAKKMLGSYEDFDCSSSRLVEEALVTLLQRKCPVHAKFLALVVDEYHMLTESQKTQLFDFLLDRSRFQQVRCIMIGNRAEKHDFDLVEKWKAEGSGRSMVQFVLARLPVIHLRSLCVQKSKPRTVQEMMNWWFGAARALFSDDVLTFRILTDVVQALELPVKEVRLGEILHRKLPQLGPMTCERISFHVLQLHSRFSRTLSLDPTRLEADRGSMSLKDLAGERDGDPFALLARTALLAVFLAYKEYPCVSEDDLRSQRVLNGTLTTDPEPDFVTLMSFSEYVNRLANSARLHPLLRLEAWVQYVYAQYPESSTPDCAVLRRLVVIDQPGFPLVTDVSLQLASIEQSRAFAEQGDYTDLEWIRVSLQRNAAIAWSRAKRVWADSFLSDVKGLLKLLKECPDPQSCLNAVAPTNLCSLLTTTLGTVLGDELAQTAADLLTRGVSEWADQVDIASNPLLHALWCCYVQGKAQTAVEKHLDSLLLWASRFVSAQLMVAVQPKDMLSRLINHLIVTTKEWTSIVVARTAAGPPTPHRAILAARAKIIKLWTGAFAHLAPSPELARDPDMQRAIFWLASSQYPPDARWPSGLRQLAALLHHPEASINLVEVARWPLFYQLREGSEAASIQLPFEEQEQITLAISLLDPSCKLPLPLGWQIALLTQLPRPWLDNKKQIEELLSDAEFVSRSFEQGLRHLQKAADIWPQWPDDASFLRDRLRTNFVHLHGVDDLTNKLDAISSIAKSKEKQRKDKEAANMKIIWQVLRVKHPVILSYYNHLLGTHSLRHLKTAQLELDKYKNPVGSQFDLARDQSFHGFSVLVGDFSTSLPYVWVTLRGQKIELARVPELTDQVDYRTGPCGKGYWLARDKIEMVTAWCVAQIPKVQLEIKPGHEEYQRELPKKMLEDNIASRLGVKGFSVRIVSSEQDFNTELESGNYDVAWVISGSVEDLERRYKDVNPAVTATHNLVTACLRFHRRGGGLFIFGENDPCCWHANAILECFAGLQLQGNNPGHNFLVTDGETPSEIIKDRVSSGKIERPNHALMTGICTLYEGITVCHPVSHNLPPSWTCLATGGFPLAQATNNRPLVMVHEAAHVGRVVVDVGYTKLWLNWREGGTDRYVCNATAWLTGIDAILKHYSPEHAPTLQELQPARHASREASRDGTEAGSTFSALKTKMLPLLPAGSDVILVVDMSGSMCKFFAQAKDFAKRIAEAFHIDQAGSRNRMGLVAFGTDSKVMAPLGSDFAYLQHAINGLHNLGGTNFAPPLRDALHQFQQKGKPRQKRLVIFQTDGENFDHQASAHAAKALVEVGMSTVYAVVVNTGNAAREGAARIVGTPGNFNLPVLTKAQTLVMTLSDYDKLVHEVSSIVSAASRAT